jgi:hypothetical protein
MGDTVIRGIVGNSDACSCGCVEPHPIATRVLPDNSAVLVWSDGMITEGRAKFGTFLRGLGRPRTKYGRSAQRRAVMLMLGDLELFNRTELPKLIKTAARTFAWNWRSEGHQRQWVLSKMNEVA